MAWGTHNEFRAVAYAEAELGVIFDHTGDNQKRWEYDWLVAYPDGDCGRTGLEVKCPEKFSDEIRPHYMAQIQGCCLVCKFAGMYFANWTNSERALWWVPRDEQYISDMTLLLEGFRAYLIQDEEPPRLSRKPKMPEVAVERIS